jgi:hypothetical protein
MSGEDDDNSETVLTRAVSLLSVHDFLGSGINHCDSNLCIYSLLDP